MRILRNKQACKSSARVISPQDLVDNDKSREKIWWIMNKYLIYTKDYRRENGVEYIPVYMTMFL